MYPELDAKIPFPQNVTHFSQSPSYIQVFSLHQENTQTSLKSDGTSDNLYLKMHFCLSAHSSLGFVIRYIIW